MKESRFYKLSLVLPLAIPALLAPLFLFDSPLPEWLQWLVIFITFSGVIGGIPYIVLVGLLFWWARGKSDTQFRRALMQLPILMLPVFDVLALLGLLIERWQRPESALPASDVLMVLLGFAPSILGFGYCFVLLVFGTAFVLKRVGILEPLPAI
jgi:hypothetical protein